MAEWRDKEGGWRSEVGGREVGRAGGRGYGIEYNVVLMAPLLAVALTGGGGVSFDARRARPAESEAAGRAWLRAGQV